MKKLLSALLVTFLLFSLVACNIVDSTLIETDSTEPYEKTTNTISTEKTTDELKTPDSTDPAHTHEFGEWTVILEAKCGTDGIEERVCSCGEREQRPITATAHDIVGNDSKREIF